MLAGKKGQTMQVRRIASLLLLVSITAPAQEKPQQLIPLKRITVGPYDNYQGSIDEAQQVLYYTRSQNLSSQIFRLDMKTGLSSVVTEQDADAKAPVISPDGKTLAFQYFKQDAKGDICIQKDEDLRCLTKPGLVEHSPFWVDANRLAYMASNDAGTSHKLMVYDLSKNKATQLLEGTLHHPQLAPNGETLVVRGRGNELVFYDFRTQKKLRSWVMDLPGVTGPAGFSADSRYLYFAQYMVDSNRDLQLDGRDAAAIYRIDTQAKGRAEPEQLTSLQQNCSYPVPTPSQLFMTCAFEGALDIYASPLEGTVPKEWTQEDLWEAHMTARSYSDRILFLNHLYGRFQALNAVDHDERNLANFIFLGEFLPAGFYAQRLAQTKAYAASDRAKLEGLLLETYARWEVLPQKENLGAFARFLEQQGPRIKPYERDALAQVVRAYFDYFAKDEKVARAKLKTVVSEDPRVLFWASRLERLMFRAQDTTTYRQALEPRILSKALSQETRLYYLSLWLEELPKGGDPTAALEALAKRLEGVSYLQELVQNEIALHRLVRASDKKEQIASYQKIVERIQRIEKDYYSMRLLFNRSLIVFASANKTQDMADIVTLWVSYLKKDSKEFPFVIEAMRRNSLDVAYRLYNGKAEDKPYAAGGFYSNLRSSDDLESHFQYTLTQMEPEAWKRLEAAYGTMVKDKMIRPSSFDFVQTVQKIMVQPDAISSQELAEAAKTIDGLPDSYVGLGTKYLFLGYLYQKRMLLEGKPFGYDRDLADLAHRSYLFAIDAAYGNDRIVGSALQNLGLLHDALRNSSLAAEFFTKRRELPFKDTANELATLWLTARALYRSYRFPEALAAIEQALAKRPEPRAPFLEKAAFYAWNAQVFEKAVTFYQEYLAQSEGKVRGGIYMAYGYALSRKGAISEAEKALLTAIETSKTEPKPKVEGASLVYQPEKVRFIAYGLLSKLDVPVAKRIAYLQERLALFPSMQSQAKIMHFTPETLSAQEVKEMQDLAYLLRDTKNAAAAVQQLERSLQQSQKHGEEYGWLSHTVMMAAKNAMIAARELDQAAAAIDDELKAILAAITQEYTEQDTPTALVTQKWGELRIVAAAHATRTQGAAAFQAATDALLREEVFANLQKEQPKHFEALLAYQRGWSKAL